MSTPQPLSPATDTDPSPREDVMRMVRDLNETVAFEDVEYHVGIMAELHQSAIEIEEGKFSTHEEVRARILQCDSR